MFINHKKHLSMLCFIISALTMIIYLFLTIKNILSFTGILFYSMIICGTLIIGILFYNQNCTQDVQSRNLRFMGYMLFAFYIFQIVYLLFFASEFARDYVDLSSISYKEALPSQWTYNTNLIPFTTIQQMINIFYIPSISNSIPLINLLGNFIAFMPFSLFVLILFPNEKKSSRFFIIMATIIIGVEITQFFTLTGSMDIDDFILNFVGVVFSYFILRYPPIYTYVSKLIK